MTDRPPLEPSPTNAARVLVLDADADLLGLIEQWLRPLGVELRPAWGRAAAAAADLVIVDLPFPSRAQVASLRADLDLPGHAPILVLSTTVFASVDCCGPAAQALGADGLLPKPTTGDALQRAVRRLIER